MLFRSFVHHALVDYVVRVVTATRTPAELGMDDVAGWIAYGASPRATLGAISAARALALVRGRDYVLPQDVVDVLADVLRHRLVLSYDALADEVPVEHVITRVLRTVGLPQVSTQSTPPAGGPQGGGPQGGPPRPSPAMAPGPGGPGPPPCAACGRASPATTCPPGAPAPSTRASRASSSTAPTRSRPPRWRTSGDRKSVV